LQLELSRQFQTIAVDIGFAFYNARVEYLLSLWSQSLPKSFTNILGFKLFAFLQVFYPLFVNIYLYI
jgi:hypothetical protein